MSILFATNLATLLVAWDANAYTNLAEELDQADSDDQQSFLWTIRHIPLDSARELCEALDYRYRE